MRDVELLDSWTVTPHHTYFIHVQQAASGEAVGLSCVQIGDGSLPCIGIDNYRRDDYPGHVVVTDGRPQPNVLIQYFRVGSGLTWVDELHTDNDGRHSIRLAPGFYKYRVHLPGEQHKEYEVLVKAGRRVRWEHIDSEGNVGDTAERPFHFVTEELICNWDNSDGDVFSWTDVTEILRLIARRIDKEGAELRAITFAQFPRADIINTLKNAGIWSFDLGWKDAAFVAAFHNVRTLAQGKGLALLNHAEARRHLRDTQAIGARLEIPSGGHNHLALARCAAIQQASVLAGGGTNERLIFDPQRERDGHGGLHGGHSVIESVFGPDVQITEQRHNPRF